MAGSEDHCKKNKCQKWPDKQNWSGAITKKLYKDTKSTYYTKMATEHGYIYLFYLLNTLK